MLKTQICRDSELAPYQEDLGRLRIRVFAEWPYLYRGDLDYEKSYLETYIRSQNSFCFLVWDDQQLIGATTAILLSDEMAEIQKPLVEAGYHPREVVYFGESLLWPEYRGQGLGKQFMEERLAFAASFPEVNYAAFCAVERPMDHKLRPVDYRPLNTFWESFGFQVQKNLRAELEWLDYDQVVPTKKTLQFWTKSLR